MIRLASWVVVGVLQALPSLCFADTAWPTRPVRIIAPGDVGGVLDIRARWLAERLTPLLGQNVIVENRPGAGGAIGTETGARSAPDGYTLTLIHLGTMAANPHLYRRLGYNPITDFVPITQITAGPLALVVHSALPAYTLLDLLRLAKARPGQLNFGSAGIGTPGHLAEELFKRAAGIDAVHVPYKGGAQAVSALLSGEMAFMVENPSVLVPHVRTARLRALAVTGPARLKSLPDVPTAREAGLPDFNFVAWTGLAAPTGTPAPIIDEVFRRIRELMATPEAAEWLESIGSYTLTDTPEAFAAIIRADYAKWGEIIRATGIRLE